MSSGRQHRTRCAAEFGATCGEGRRQVPESKHIGPALHTFAVGPLIWQEVAFAIGDMSVQAVQCTGQGIGQHTDCRAPCLSRTSRQSRLDVSADLLTDLLQAVEFKGHQRLSQSTSN
ncbi:hypothetical protein D9M69_329680 [compost metagenome]